MLPSSRKAMSACAAEACWPRVCAVAPSQAGQLSVAINLRVPGMKLNRVGALLRGQVDVALENQQTLVGLESRAYRASTTLLTREIDALIGAGDAGLLIKDQAAGGDVDFAVSVGSVCLLLRAGRRLRTHQCDFYRTGCGCDAALLVILEFVTLNAIDAIAILAVELNFYIVQRGVVVLELDHARGVDFEDGVAAVRLRVSHAIGFLLDVDAQALGNVAAVEGAFPSAHSEEDGQNHNQQNACSQNQRTDSFDREAHGLIPHAEASGKPLGKTLPQLAPQYASGRSGILFDGRSQRHQLANVFFDVTGGLRIQFRLFFKERNI